MGMPHCENTTSYPILVHILYSIKCLGKKISLWLLCGEHTGARGNRLKKEVH